MSEAIAFLLLGGFLGVQHALEADHLSAVITLSSQNNSQPNLQGGFKSKIIKRGLSWGMGHSLTLIVFASLQIFLGITIPEHIEPFFELCVGIIIVILGLNIWRNAVRNKIHLHAHAHGKTNEGSKLSSRHFHLHSHAHDALNINDPHHLDRHHEHNHHSHLKTSQDNFPALFMGMLQGLAGSGALIILAVSATQSVMTAVIYVLSFVTGSIIGMILIIYALSQALPHLIQKSGQWITLALSLTGGVAIFIGSHLIYQSI